ncbi:unnamed protein product [Gadus morhua 'NCC']
MRPSDDGGSQRWSGTITESIQADAEVILAPGWLSGCGDRRSPPSSIFQSLHPAFCHGSFAAIPFPWAGQPVCVSWKNFEAHPSGNQALREDTGSFLE